MNIIVFGAAGFIGTNLAIELSKNSENIITLVDQQELYFEKLKSLELPNVRYEVMQFTDYADFGEILSSQDMVYHLVSTTVPTTSNNRIPEELNSNVIMTSKMLEACVSKKVKKVVFISSGGTVYGKEAACPLKEDTPTNPITSYGLQKVTIEKLLYLYNYMYGLDYRIVRLANPYGPYQRPNGILGAVTTFTFKALNQEIIDVYGDGTVVRDFIYIDDAVKGIINIANYEGKYHRFNLGSGKGTSIKEVLKCISETLQIELNVKYKEGRSVDVPVNYLDISRYEREIGKLNPIELGEGISRTASFMKKEYNI